MSGDAGLRIVVNPKGLDAAIGVDFLARCFGTPWTEAMYRWYLQRAFGSEAPDRLILMDGERVVAGCGLAYRLLRTPDGATHRVSVIVAAATVPGQRRRGSFVRMAQASVARSALRGCTAMLAFVTADNASSRGLRRLDATEIASVYIASRGPPRLPGAGTLRVCGTLVTDRWLARASARLRSAPPRAVFDYPDPLTWRSQMVARPHPVQSLRVGSTHRALIERVGDTERLQWLDGDPRERAAAIRALAAHAFRRRRQFFMYSTRRDDVESARRLGLVSRQGYMMALATEQRHAPTVRGWAALSWDVQSGDRM